MDTCFAQGVTACIRKSLIYSSLHVSIPRERNVQSSTIVLCCNTPGREPPVKSLLARFVESIIDTADEGVEDHSVQAMQLGKLCCEMTLRCIRDADAVLREFSLCVSQHAMKQLAVAAIKLQDTRCAVRVCMCVCMCVYVCV